MPWSAAIHWSLVRHVQTYEMVRAMVTLKVLKWTALPPSYHHHHRVVVGRIPFRRRHERCGGRCCDWRPPLTSVVVGAVHLHRPLQRLHRRARAPRRSFLIYRPIVVIVVMRMPIHVHQGRPRRVEMVVPDPHRHSRIVPPRILLPLRRMMVRGGTAVTTTMKKSMSTNTRKRRKMKRTSERHRALGNASTLIYVITVA